MSEICPDTDDAMPVLVADGSELCRGKFQALLIQWGFSVVEAKDGQEALAVYEEGSGPQLLL